MFIGYVFHELRTNGRIVVPPLPNPLALVEGIVNSGRSKPDWIDLPNWPTFIDLPGARQTFVSALVISVLFAAVLGLILHFLIFRPLRFAPPLAKVVASVGLLHRLPGRSSSCASAAPPSCRRRSSTTNPVTSSATS